MSRSKVRTTPPRTCTWPFVEKEKASSKPSFLGSTSVFRGVCKIVNDIHSHLLPHESCGHVATGPCASGLTSHRQVSKMRLHDTSTSSKGMLGTHAILPYPVTCDDRRRFMIAPFFVAQIRLWPNLHELPGVEELLRELVANVCVFFLRESLYNMYIYIYTYIYDGFSIKSGYCGIEMLWRKKNCFCPFWRHSS